MAKRFTAAAEVSRAMQAAGEGDFASLFEGETDEWWAFVRERIDLGADELVIRIDFEDASFGPWCVWLSFSVQERGTALSLDDVFVPDYENHPEAALANPEGREQVPYFILS